MGSVERVSKYLADAQQLVSANPLKPEKISSEVSKLATWLRKHQDEALPEGSKGQLLECIQLYYKTAASNPEIKEAVYKLIDDLLKMPEGKLVSSKSKKSALKWLGALEGDEGGRAGEIADTERDETSGKSRAMEVIDIDEGGKLQVMNSESGETVEDVVVPDGPTLQSIRETFDSGATVCVMLSAAGSFEFVIPLSS